MLATMEKSNAEVEKLIKKNDVQGQNGKLVIERAKGEEEPADAVFHEFPEAVQVLFESKTESNMTLREAKQRGEEKVLQFDPNAEVEKLIKKNDFLGQIAKLVIDRAKGKQEPGAWISTLPRVTTNEFQKAEVLFGSRTESKVTLRKAKQLGEEIVLLQFDPNFKSDDVVCRHPSCKNKNSKAAKRGQGNKRDLYLCHNHREELKSRICKAFEKEKIEFSSGEFTSEPGRFEGYTSLIGVLEGAYREARKLPIIRDTSEIVEEAILNVRNFLIITNTLLNPDDSNLGIALPAVFCIFQRMLDWKPESTEKQLRRLLSFLKEVVDKILFPFGVIYTWVSLANPGTQIGAIVGGFIGAIGFALGPLSGTAGTTAGATLGGLFGYGIYKITRERRDQQSIATSRKEFLEAARNKEPVFYAISGGNTAELVMELTSSNAFNQ